MSRALIPLFSAASLLTAACGDVVRAPLTIVVDTDRSRALEDQDRLQALRVGVQGDRAELAAARSALEQARRRLESAAQGAEREAALAEVRALEARVPAATGNHLTRSELDAALADHEQRVAAIIAAEMGRAPAPERAVSSSTSTSASSSPPTSSSPQAGASASEPMVLAAMDRARRAARARGLSLVDLDGGAVAADQVTANLKRGDLKAALDGATALAALAEATAVDGALLKRKYNRVNVLVTRAPANSQAAALLRAASTATTSGDLPTANTKLNEALAAIGQ